MSPIPSEMPHFQEVVVPLESQTTDKAQHSEGNRSNEKIPIKKKWARWTSVENDLLKAAIKSKTGCYKDYINWNEISKDVFKGRKSSMQCRNHWNKVLRPGLRRGKWTREEDAYIFDKVQKSNRVVNWKEVAKSLPFGPRHVDQVRERYENYIDPSLKPGRSPWSKEELDSFESLHRKHGNKWKLIASHLPGRSVQQCKNKYYNSKNISTNYSKKSEK